MYVCARARVCVRACVSTCVRACRHVWCENVFVSMEDMIDLQTNVTDISEAAVESDLPVRCHQLFLRKPHYRP